jgi:hypothetical protein
VLAEVVVDHIFVLLERLQVELVVVAMVRMPTLVEVHHQQQEQLTLVVAVVEEHRVMVLLVVLVLLLLATKFKEIIWHITQK